MYCCNAVSFIHPFVLWSKWLKGNNKWAIISSQNLFNKYTEHSMPTHRHIVSNIYAPFLTVNHSHCDRLKCIQPMFWISLIVNHALALISRLNGICASHSRVDDIKMCNKYFNTSQIADCVYQVCRTLIEHCIGFNGWFSSSFSAFCTFLSLSQCHTTGKELLGFIFVFLCCFNSIAPRIWNRNICIWMLSLLLFQTEAILRCRMRSSIYQSDIVIAEEVRK